MRCVALPCPYNGAAALPNASLPLTGIVWNSVYVCVCHIVARRRSTACKYYTYHTSKIHTRTHTTHINTNDNNAVHIAYMSRA